MFLTAIIEAKEGREVAVVDIPNAFIQTHIETPKKLTKRQQELLRELADLDHKHVSPERKSFFEKVKDYFAPVEENN